MEDIHNSFTKKKQEASGFDIKLLIETSFVRDNPLEQKKAVGKQTKTIDIRRQDGCSSMQKLEDLTKLNCEDNARETDNI